MLGQQHRQRLRGGPIAGQHDGPAAAAHRGVWLRGDQADHLGVIHVPAHPGARQRHRGHVRQHGHVVVAEQPDQGGADTMQQRVAAGNHV